MSSPLTRLEVQSPVRAPRPSALVIKCGIPDRLVQELAVPVAFFFSRKLDEATLRDGLARALEQVPPFAGRIRAEGGGFDIVCDNTGVSWSSATVDLGLEEVIAANARGEAKWLVEMVVPRRARTSRAPLLTVRVSTLNDGATALGLCWHHSIGDMHSFMLLMRAWSAAVEGRALPEALVVEDREAYLMPLIPPGGSDQSALRQLSGFELARLVPYMLWDARRKKLVQVAFARPELEGMRAALGEACGRRLSFNDAVCAHLMEVVSAFDGLGKPRVLSVAVNYRKRAGLDARLVGNVVTSLDVLCQPGEPAAQIGGRIREGIDAFTERHLNINASLKFVDALGGVTRVGRCVPICIDPLNRTLLLTNWSNFGVYDVSFGGQTPDHFTPTGDTPFPWLGGLVEGRGNQGLLFSSYFPPALAARLNSDQGLARLHRFRPA